MRLFLSIAIALACLTACGTDGGGDATSAPATSETSETSETTISQEPTSDAPPTDIPADDSTEGVPPFPEHAARETVEHSGEWDLVFTDIRVAEHEGFDRIVLEFTGTGSPGWQVNYVDEAVLDGSGEAVTLDGDAVLDIYASGTTWPAAGYYSGPRQFEPENGGDISDVHVGGTFEGYTQVLAGIDGDPLPFRVLALTDPSRLVVDVVDGSAD